MRYMNGVNADILSPNVRRTKNGHEFASEDIFVIATSPRSSDSPRKRSETSLLTSLPAPFRRAERVLPAHTESHPVSGAQKNNLAE